MGTRQEGDRRARRLLRPLAGERGGRRRTGLPAGEVRMGQGAGDRSGLGHLALRVWTTRTRRDSRAHAPRKREVAPCDGAAEDEIRRRRELLWLQLRLVLRLARRVAARRLALPRHPITPPKKFRARRVDLPRRSNPHPRPPSSFTPESIRPMSCGSTPAGPERVRAPAPRAFQPRRKLFGADVRRYATTFFNDKFMTRGKERGYRPVRDYALIGDAHTAALVAKDGSIDWCCWPRFDSPAVFCRLLDAARGGWSQICPADAYEVSRSYVGTTNVLAAEFKTGGGRVRLTDFMPVERLTESHRGEDIAPSYRILRLVEGLAGSVEMEVGFRPTFDYARADTVLEACESGAVATAGREALALTCAARMRRDESGALAGRFKVKEGERVWFALNYFTDVDPQGVKPPRAESEDELKKTLGYWEEWWRACR